MLCKIGIAVLKWAVNVEDHSVFGENLAIPVKGQHAAAGGDDGWTKCAYPAGDLVFIIAEKCFAAFGKDFRDRHLIMFDQHLVSIVKWKSKTFGEQLSDGGLSAACKAT